MFSPPSPSKIGGKQVVFPQRPVIGSLQLENPFVLAPMAGIGDPPFRRLCRKGGAAMVCSEMVSSNALHFNDRKSLNMLRVFPDEHPVSVQIFGSDPQRLSEAAKRVEGSGADVVDLNAGCPVPKITKSGAGISLMQNEDLLARCLESLVKSVSIPVTIKMRIGWETGKNRAPDLARRAAAVGVKAIFVHARYQAARHEGPPDLPALRETVAAVSIPVFGNGGVSTFQGAKGMLEKTGCAGVMLGQAAMGNPLIFWDLLGEDFSGKGEFPSPPQETQKDRLELLRTHGQLNVEFYGEPMGIIRLRKFFPAYFRGFPGAALWRQRANTWTTLKELEEAVEILSRLPQEGDLTSDPLKLQENPL